MTADPLLPEFHLLLHGRPAEVEPAAPFTLNGLQLKTVSLSVAQQATPFEIDFETAVERLADLSRMFVEPDGSFVWVSNREAVTAWQVDGVVSDRAERVIAVELKGTCSRDRFEQLLRVFDWPAAPLLIQVVQAATILEVDEFFRSAADGTK